MNAITITAICTDGSNVFSHVPAGFREPSQETWERAYQTVLEWGRSDSQGLAGPVFMSVGFGSPENEGVTEFHYAHGSLFRVGEVRSPEEGRWPSSWSPVA